MSASKSPVQSPEAIARAARRRLAAEEGVRAIGDFERQAIEVRKNMARLRELREAREVEDAALAASRPLPAPKKRKKKSPL